MNDTVWVMSTPPAGAIPCTVGPLDINGDTTLAPALPGKNITFTDPAFGATILQVTDATDPGTSNIHGYAAWPAMSRDNAYFIIQVNGTWQLYSFASGPPMSSAFVRDFPNQSYNWEKSMWDLGGSNNHLVYVVLTSTSEANRKIDAYDADANTTTLVKSFGTLLRTTGTITSATDSSHFASTNIVQPVSDYTPEYFTNMALGFTSGALNGQEQIISSFTEAGGAFVTAAFTGTPGVGDAFYVRPAGYTSNLDVGESGRYFVCVAYSPDQGNQDARGCLVAYDKTLDTVTVHHCSSAEVGDGIHQTYISKDQPYCAIWGIPGNTFNIWNFSANTMATKQTDFSHADGGSDVWAQIGPAANVLTTRPFASPTDSPTTIATLDTKQGKTRFTMDTHISWCNYHLNQLFLSSYFSLQLTGLTLYSGTVGVDALYKKANWLGVSAQALPLTAANQGMVLDGGTIMMNQGSASGNAATAALITGNGQWAYDTTNNDLFVRGLTAQDLTDTTTYYILAQDYRSQHDELTRFDFSVPGRTCYIRVCRLYAWGRSNALAYGDAPRACVSYDGRYVVFDSTWGGRTRRDVFIVKVPA